MAIWRRVTRLFGQKFPPPQPVVMPSAARASIQSAKVEGQGTSGNTLAQGGGT